MSRIVLFALALALGLSSPALADFKDGKAAYDSKKWEQAIINLRPLAESGDARAMVLLGNMYAQGYGVGKNETEAYTLYHRAALAGNGEAMVVTAAMLQQGLGVKEDVPLAIEWYKRAAQTGQAAGALFYGLYMFRGNNVKDADRNILPNPALAYQWMRICEKSSKDAKMKDTAGKLAVEMAKQLKPEDIKAVDETVAAWKPTPASELGPAPGITLP